MKVAHAVRCKSTYPTATERLLTLRRLMEERKKTEDVVRVMEAHSGLSALIAEKARGENGQAFDAVWSSSLTSSTIKGKPDIETVDTSARVGIVEDILEVCSLPMVYDGDTGGEPQIFHFTVRTLERLGVSACIIEDKTGLKQNSLFGTDRKQQLEDINTFCAKIKAGKNAQVTKEFMVVARMESLIAGWGEEEALNRAKACIEAGVDAIMIHSKEKKPDEVLSFLEAYNKFPNKVPVVAVPTTYNTITEKELARQGVSIVIHANQLLRASYYPMFEVAQSILTHGRSNEADSKLMGVKEILTLIDDGTGN